MTLPSSGALALSQVQTEFGGANPIAFSEYYAGGSYVVNGTSGVNGAVPTSGALSMSKFYGTSALVVNNFTVTSGTYSSGVKGDFPYYGYAVNQYDIVAATHFTIGSIAPGSTYPSSAGTKTIYGVYSQLTDIYFSLLTSADDSTAFTQIVVNGTTLTRASGSYVGFSTTFGNVWSWNPGSGIIPTSGTFSFSVTHN